MEQNLNSEKTPARASQAATGTALHNSSPVAQDEQQRLDEIAMKAAKRAGNRFRDDEGTVPGSTEFTK